MKRYGHLYPQVYDLDNIRAAHRNARQGKGHYPEVRRVEKAPEVYFTRIQEMLKKRTYQTSGYTHFETLCSGKQRHISKLPYFPDRIVHHAIMLVVEPIWARTLIADTYACIKGRGIHRGARRIKDALKQDPSGTRFCLKCDVKQFYPSVDHAILKRVLRRKIKDADLLWLLGEIIDSAPGLPIGNYLSQHFGNLYLSGLDHWLKEEARCRYYYRYCDDLVVLHGNKAFLHDLRGRIQAVLQDELALELKGNWQVFPVAVRGVDFLGYRFFPGYTLARKGIAKRFKRKVGRIRRRGRSMEPCQVVNSLMSYHGWFVHANCRRLLQSHLDADVLEIATEACQELGVRVPAVLEAESEAILRFCNGSSGAGRGQGAPRGHHRPIDCGDRVSGER